MKKKRLLTLIGVLSVLLLVGASVSAQQKLTIHMLGYDTGIQYLQDVIIPEFEAKYGVEVDLVRVTWGTRADRLITATAGGVPPDIFMSGAEQLPELVEAGLIAPIDHYIEEWGELDDFYPGALGSSEYKGVRYGLPIYTSPRVTWIRKDFFAEAGLDPLSPPSNWDELLEAARRLTRVVDGNTVVRQGYDLHKINGNANQSLQEFTMFLAQNGGQVFDPVTGRAAFNTPAGYDAVDFMKTMKDIVLPPGHRLSMPAGSGNNLWRGGSAMIVESSYILADFVNRQPNISEHLSAIVPPPGNTDNVTVVYNDWLGIHAHSPNKDLAWEFMKMFFSAETLRNYGLAAGYQSPRRSTFMDFVREEPLVQYVYQTLEYGKPYEMMTPAVNDLIDAFGPLYRQVLNNEQGITTAVDEIARRWDVILGQ